MRSIRHIRHNLPDYRQGLAEIPFTKGAESPTAQHRLWYSDCCVAGNFHLVMITILDKYGRRFGICVIPADAVLRQPMPLPDGVTAEEAAATERFPVVVQWLRVFQSRANTRW